MSDLETLITEENVTLDELQAQIAGLRTYAVIQFTRGISEFAGTGTHLIPVKLSLCGGLPLSAAVTVQVSAVGTGLPGYTLNTTSLTFPANSQDGDVKNVSVTIDQADAGDKITLSLGSPTGPATLDTLRWN